MFVEKQSSEVWPTTINGKRFVKGWPKAVVGKTVDKNWLALHKKQWPKGSLTTIVGDNSQMLTKEDRRRWWLKFFI